MSDRTEICTTTTTVSEGVRTRYGGNADSSDTDSTDIAMKNCGGSKVRRTASPASSTGDEEGGRGGRAGDPHRVSVTLFLYCLC